MSGFTLIYYYIPEDNESIDELNTFGIQKSRDQITLKDIKNNFPIKGDYIFRFQTKYNKKNIFIDVLNEDDNVPLIDKKVIAKVSRLNWVKNEEEKKDTKRQSTNSKTNQFDFPL